MINLADRIGTMVFSSNGNYIVGGSDRQNAEFQKKCRNNIVIEESKLRDRAEITGIKKIQYNSENYNDINKVTGMPKSCFADSYGNEIRNSIQSLMSEYCDGKISEEELEDSFYDICKDMRVYQAQSRSTTGMDTDDNTQIIEEVYEVFQKSNVKSMVDKCFETRKEVADYYQKSQKVREILQRAAHTVASDWGIGTLDCKKVEEESKLTLDGRLDFISAWNWKAYMEQE